MDDALRVSLQRRRDVADRLRTLLIESLHVPFEPQEIDDDVVLFGSGLGLDSVDALELVVAAESTFGVTLPQQGAAAAMRTLNSLADYVLAQKAAQ